MATKKRKNPAAQALGRLRMKKLKPEERTELGQKGGAKGGKARAEKLTPEKRSAIAKAAAAARWGAKKTTSRPSRKKP